MPPMLMTALFSMLLNLIAPHAGFGTGGAGLPHLSHVERTAIVLVDDRGQRGA